MHRRFEGDGSGVQEEAMSREQRKRRSGADAPRTSIGNRMSRVARLFLVGCVAAGSVWSMPTAGADPLVCVTVYYRVLGGPKQYVFNNECYIPTPWPTVAGAGISCTTADGILQVCRQASFAMP